MKCQNSTDMTQLSTSLPTWGRGLKCLVKQSAPESTRSLPTWGCGLKYWRFNSYNDFTESLPMWGRGLKYTTQCIWRARRTSLPMWERGLKSMVCCFLEMDYRKWLWTDIYLQFLMSSNEYNLAILPKDNSGIKSWKMRKKVALHDFGRNYGRRIGIS